MNNSTASNSKQLEGYHCERCSCLFASNKQVTKLIEVPCIICASCCRKWDHYMLSHSLWGDWCEMLAEENVLFSKNGTYNSASKEEFLDVLNKKNKLHLELCSIVDIFLNEIKK